MRRYAGIVAAVLAFFTTTWLAVEALGVPLLSEPDDELERDGPSEALLALALLLVDAVVPVASSVVMLALGRLYGAPLGIVLALLGRSAMGVLGFAVGRRGGPLLDRMLREGDRERADDLLRRRGALAIVASRPVPLIAETVTVIAGASGMPWRRALPAIVIGSIPEAVAYGVAGAVSADFEEGAAVWILFLVVVAAFWLAERRLRPAARTGMPGPG